MTNRPSGQSHTPSPDGSPSFLLASARWLPWVIILAGLLVGAVVLLSHFQANARLQERLRAEHLLRLGSAREHVENYFDSVFSTLYFITQDDDVQAMTPNSRDLIQRLYLHQWERHRLSHMYVIERDFTGTNAPFLTFDTPGPDGKPLRAHPLSRELEEYQVQKAQIQRFVSATNLPALISGEIQLCVEDPAGGRARGVVYSLPVRYQGSLSGIVAGMIEIRTLETVLLQGHTQQTVFLVNEWGACYGGGQAPEPLRSWLQSHLTEASVSCWSQAGGGDLEVNNWRGFWTPARVASAERWWLVYFYDSQSSLADAPLTGLRSAFALAGALALTGILLSLLVRSAAQRLGDEIRHLRAQEALERRLQQVIEAEHRRIGFNLHEDLCQQLCGIGYLMTVLEQQVKSKTGDLETGLADISEKLQASFNCAQKLADELQPVSSLDEGFVAALATLTAQTRKTAGVDCQLEEEPLPPIDPGVGTHLYRIAQQAIDNAIRHGKAKRIKIQVSTTTRSLDLRISDDGIGLPEGAERSGGIGLPLMRYRCHLIGATLEVASDRKSGGAVVTCHWPLALAGASQSSPADSPAAPRSGAVSRI